MPRKLKVYRIPPWSFARTASSTATSQWKTLGPDVAALEDRGHLIHFAPSAVEIHRHAACWVEDQETLDFVGAHLHLIQRHSVRIYTLASELKAAGIDWKSAVLSRCLSGKAREVALLLADAGFATEEERVRAFEGAGHGSRATYFNHKRRLVPTDPGPRLNLLAGGRGELRARFSA